MWLPFVLVPPFHTHPARPPVSLLRALARASFLDIGGQKELGSWSLGGTVKGWMTAIPFQPISERCRPLTPVEQRTELKKKKKKAKHCLPAYVSEGGVSSHVLLLALRNDPKLAGLKDKCGNSAGTPPLRVPG